LSNDETDIKLSTFFHEFGPLSYKEIYQKNDLKCYLQYFFYASEDLIVMKFWMDFPMCFETIFKMGRARRVTSRDRSSCCWRSLSWSGIQQNLHHPDRRWTVILVSTKGSIFSSFPTSENQAELTKTTSQTKSFDMTLRWSWEENGQRRICGFIRDVGIIVRSAYFNILKGVIVVNSSTSRGIVNLLGRRAIRLTLHFFCQR
jgi:hypothetical protein